VPSRGRRVVRIRAGACGPRPRWVAPDDGVGIVVQGARPASAWWISHRTVGRRPHPEIGGPTAPEAVSIDPSRLRSGRPDGLSTQRGARMSTFIKAVVTVNELLPLVLAAAFGVFLEIATEAYLLPSAIRLNRCWVRAVTLGLPPCVRSEHVATRSAD